jgi:hypothetical protein
VGIVCPMINKIGPQPNSINICLIKDRQVAVF